MPYERYHYRLLGLEGFTGGPTLPLQDPFHLKDVHRCGVQHGNWSKRSKPYFVDDGKGYMAKQAPIITRDRISTFLQQPDSEFLPQKVKECSLHRIIKSSLPSIHFQSFCFLFIHFTGHRCTGNVLWAAKVRDV